MFEFNDIVRLKSCSNLYAFYRITEVDDMIKAKNLNLATETYFTEDEIEKATLSELLSFCNETEQILYIDVLYSETADKLETIGKALIPDNENFHYQKIPFKDNYYFYFGDTLKDGDENILKVFELDIDIDSTYTRVLEELKERIKERIKEKVKQLKIDVKLGDYIKYKNKLYHVVMIKDDFLYLIEQTFTTDPAVTLLTITFKDLAEYQDSAELHLEDHIVQPVNLSDHIKDYSEEIKMNTLSAIKLGDTEYSINDKCSACKSEEYITRDEAKEMIEEMFNKINNKEIKEMEFSKTMCEKISKEDNVLDDYLKEVLRKALEKEETKANVEGKPLPNLYEKYGDLFKDADEVEAIYINVDKKVIVLKWISGETTKAVCDPQDKFDIEAGVFLALAKRYYDYETIADCCDWKGITPDMEKGVFFGLAQDFFDIFEIKRYVNWAKKVYAKQTKKEVKPKTSKKVK